MNTDDMTWDEHVSAAEHHLRAASRAAAAGNMADALPQAKQAEYEAAQLVHALEMELRK